MKIGYFADGPWSHQAIEKISLEKKYEIVFIVPRHDTQDHVLKNWSDKLGIDFLIMENINSNTNIDLLKKYNAELFVSMSYNQIIKKKLIDIAPKGFINCHAGSLPFYRGRNVLNWVLINDEKYFGITVHYIDEGIDTGDIILQEKFEITDSDNYGTLLNRAYKGCADLLLRSLNLIELNNVSVIEQKEIDSNGSYFRGRGPGDEIIDWKKSTREIFNFIRAITTPGPLARSFMQDNEVLFEEASIINFDTFNYSSNTITPGTIINIIDSKPLIKTGDSYILITKFKFDLNNKTKLKLKINDTFQDKKIL